MCDCGGCNPGGHCRVIFGLGGGSPAPSSQVRPRRGCTFARHRHPITFWGLDCSARRSVYFSNVRGLEVCFALHMCKGKMLETGGGGSGS